MKLSFSLSSKSSSKQSQTKPSQSFNTPDQTQTHITSHTKEFLTEFDSSKPSNTQPKKLIIPPIPNDWRPHKKMKSISLPTKSETPNLQFETAPSSIPDNPNISFGLNLRQSAVKTENSEIKIEDSGTLLETNQNPDFKTYPNHVKAENLDTLLENKHNPEPNMLKKFKEDLSRLPEDRGFAEFDDVPVEGFGAALLAGYGWYEGRGIGKNAKEDVKVVEYERRIGKSGLGFVADDPVSAAESRNGKVRNDRFGVGKDVRVVWGRDMGLKGRILEVVGDGFVVLRLARSDEEVRVRVTDVAELGSVEEERCLKKLKELKIRGSKSKESNRDKRKEKLGTISEVCWLTSHIRVRVISKDLKGGKLYLKKGKVVDVVGPMKCDISMDDSGKLIQGVDQELLETALPRTGGPVLVLYGRKKGVYGNLVEKDMENETGVVRDADTHALVTVKLEQIAEYIGDPSDIGY